MSAEADRKALMHCWEDQICAAFNDEDSELRAHTQAFAEAMLEVWRGYMAVGADSLAVTTFVMELVGGMVRTLGYCQMQGML